MKLSEEDTAELHKSLGEKMGLPDDEEWLKKHSDAVKIWFEGHKDVLADVSARFVADKVPALAGILAVDKLGDSLVRFGLLMLQLGYYLGVAACESQQEQK